MRFLLDMGISQNVVLWLKSQEHDAIHLNEENLFKLSDDLILEKAINENRIILTADMDFGQLLSFDHSRHASVIQFRVTNFKADNIISKLKLLFDTFTNQLDTDFIITVEDNRIRYRKLPLGN